MGYNLIPLSAVWGINWCSPLRNVQECWGALTSQAGGLFMSFLHSWERKCPSVLLFPVRDTSVCPSDTGSWPRAWPPSASPDTEGLTLEPDLEPEQGLSSIMGVMSVSDMRDGGNTHVVCTTPVNFSLAPTKLLHFGAVLALLYPFVWHPHPKTVSSFLTSFPSF